MLNSPKTQGRILTRTYDEQVTLGSWGSWKKSKGTSVKADSLARWTARNIRKVALKAERLLQKDKKKNRQQIEGK